VNKLHLQSFFIIIFVKNKFNENTYHNNKLQQKKKYVTTC
jgi:hypothetical protein